MKLFTSCALLLIGIAGASAASQSPAEAVYAWGQSQNGLRLGIAGTRTTRASGAVFTIAVQNISTGDLVVNLGSMLGNGAMFTSAVRLTLIDAAGATRDLHFFEHPGVAGWLGDYAAALRPGATYTLPISLDQYRTGASPTSLTPGRHRITAVFEWPGETVKRATQLNLPYWKGEVRSRSLDFEVTR